MKEEFLHFIWKNCLFDNDALFTSDNKKVDIISPGEQNQNAGPDFISARIRIDHIEWAGNVEIHIRSSDWKQHHHHLDKKYNNVVLHVVEQEDCETMNEQGKAVPTLKLRYPDLYLRNYLSLQKNINWISCRHKIKERKPDNFILNNWLVNLAVERIENKTTHFHSLLSYTKNNWEEAFYIFFAKYFGGSVNTTAFEMLAKSMPQKILAKHKNNKMQIEALLFGQGGFLEEPHEDEYYLSLQTEYHFLKNKYHLKAIDNTLWNYFRLRPSAFPALRLAEFSSLIQASTSLFSTFIQAKNIQEVVKCFRTPVSTYWNHHVKFGKKTTYNMKKMGIQSIYTLIINSIIPVMFSYGKVYLKSSYQEKAIDWLEQIPPENNSIIRKWRDVDIYAKNALESQALIQLKKLYCDKKKCLNCHLGKILITSK